MGKTAIQEGLERWVDRWAASSDSGGGDYIVAVDREGKYACSCRGWTLHMYCPACQGNVKKGQDRCPACRCDLNIHKPERADCKHIGRAKRGHWTVRTISQAVLERMLG